jgi:recombination protein U
MAKNIGKIFEGEVKASFPPDFFVERYKDDTAGFKGVCNPADFRVYKHPFTFLIECKSHKGKSLPFDKIRRDQIEKQVKYILTYNGVFGGFLINYRDLEETYYVNAGCVLSYMNNANRKSIPVEWCRESGKRVGQTKKRVRYSYDIAKLLEEYYD